jgi:predicted site-specific integrase-resolvase
VSDLGTLLTLKETAERLGVSVKTARRMVTRGDFPGAHQAPMPTGKGTQWVVPVSSVLPHENERAQVQASTPANMTAQEIADLRAQVDRLQAELNVQRALADDRAHALEQLHLTVRMALTAGDEPRKRGLFGRKRDKSA